MEQIESETNTQKHQKHAKTKTCKIEHCKYAKGTRLPIRMFR